MPKFLLKFLAIIPLFFALFPIAALDVPVARISDDSQLRNKLKDAWFLETPASVLARRPVIESLPTGERAQISAINGNNEITILISREDAQGRFTGWAQGSWMLTRRRDTGAGTRIRIYLRSDQYTYIDFRPLNADRSQMDAVLYGGYIARALPIGVPFERLYTMKLNDILALAGAKFPRQYFDPDPGMYRDTRAFVAQVRGRLNEVRYENNDGAIDELGNYVFIETLAPQNYNSGHVNCSGFLKWLVDGCLRPITGKRLSVAELKKPFGNRGSSLTELWENYARIDGQLVEREIPLSVRRDPYFGLDWIRNLASEANGTLRSERHRALEEFEVRSDNFSLIIANENPNGRTPVYADHNYPGFLPEAGYGFEGLHALLYTLAIENPYSFYLAAISNEIGAAVTPDNLRGAPRLRQYYHLAALVPYFDEDGAFRIAVFESATESSFAGFNRRYPGHYINLVSIPVPARFDP